MEVYYNNKLLINKEFLSMSQTQHQPEIKLNVDPSKFYTLIMNDPNAIGGNFIHWIIMNISSNNINNGIIIVPYQKPTPPPKTGTHNYIFELYLQDRENTNIESISKRTIDMNSLKNKLGLNNLIYKIQFRSESEVGGKIKRRKTKIRKTNKSTKTKKNRKL